MPRGSEFAWPGDDEIVAGIVEHGSQVKYAQALGVSDKSLGSRLNRSVGLRDRAKSAVAEQRRLRAAKPTPGTPVSREEVLAQENSELRAAMSKERKAEIRRERMMLAIEHALERVEPPAPLDISLAPIRKDDPAHHRVLLLLSDAHGGEVVKAAAVNGVNAYDWEIMHERHREILRGVASHLRRMPPVTGIDLAILGDNNSGANHDELRVTNEYPLARQGILMGYLLGDFVAKLAALARDVYVLSVPGNHPRLTDKPAAKDVDNNMDVVSTVLAEERTRHLKNVRWRQPEGAAMFHEIAGRVCYIWHGDGIRSSMPGVPWGGVMRRTNSIQSQHPRHIDHFVLGHFHQANVVQAGRILMNGSVKGPDEWCLKQFGYADPPTQLLVLFDEDKRRLTDVKYLTPTAGIPGVE